METNKPKQRGELLFTIPRKEFKISFFCSGGNGGQNQNKVATACRIVHEPSGAVAESREERTQGANRKIACDRLIKHPKLLAYIKRKKDEIDSKQTLEQKIEESMLEKNLLLEVRDENGKWIKVEPDSIKE